MIYAERHTRVNGLTGIMVKAPLTQQEKLEAFRQDMKERRRGEPWYTTALRLDEAMSDAASFGYGEDIVRRLAEEASGLSRGVLTRYVSTIRRVKAAAAAAGVQTNSLLSPGFNGVETAVRLYDRSPAQGLDTLKKLADGKLTLSQVKSAVSRAFEASEESFGARSRTLRRRGFEIQAVYDAIAGYFPKDSLITRRPPMRYFRHVGWEVRTAGGACVCAVDAMAPRTEDPSFEFETLFPSAALLSQYFPSYYVAFSPASPAPVADQAVAAIERLGLKWFGVMKTGSDGGLEVLRKPEGRPVPDHVDRYESLRGDLMLHNTRWREEYRS